MVEFRTEQRVKAKGFLAFGDHSGYWVMHTIPKFGLIKRYEYPKNAFKFGQCAICVHFNVSELNKICKYALLHLTMLHLRIFIETLIAGKHLLFTNPKIHLKQISDKMSSKLDKYSKSLFEKKPKFVRSGNLTNKSELKSAGYHVFISFAKASKCKKDLYGDIIAPGIKSSLLVETWRRGKNMNETCRTKYTVNDIVAINMTVKDGRRKKMIDFQSFEDHSKWAISTRNKMKWICITDMNRMVSQQKRGGGALCFQSSKVWSAFNNIIAETGEC
nr:plancitoxin-1-like [Parasteatoda tepidariorum]